jgi:molecular chaperone DnaK
MARQKIDYGIDLGTTNSTIARMEAGKIRVIKSDDEQKEITPSCVSLNKNRTIFVGITARNHRRREDEAAFRRHALQEKNGRNAYLEFKREMGTDVKHYSSYMGKEFTPEELSSEVLKKLKGYIRDEKVPTAIITIPMRFGQHQVDATRRAAELAGFQYIETLQEPIAASIVYGLESKKTQGYWLVFDLGGGTFDAALLRVVDGIMKVEDTAGDTRLGGRDIDYAIVDNIFIPYLKQSYKIEKILNDVAKKRLLRDALKWVAEEAKIPLSKDIPYNVYPDEPIGPDDNGKEMELDIKIAREEFQKVAEPIFQRAINISKELITKHDLKGKDLDPVILVGGPTHSQTLRDMLIEQLSPNIFFNIDPMTAVAQGAALYASTRDCPLTLQKRDKTKIQLTLKYPETTVEIEENLGIKLERRETIGTVPERVFVEISRDDKAWSSGKIEIKSDAEIIPINLKGGEPNSFSINVFDENGNTYLCEPSSVTIIQGLKAAEQIIPYTFCVDVVFIEKGEQRLIELKGLEKNQTLPAKGKPSKPLRTQIDVRPGNKNDIIEIPVYGGDAGTRGLYNNWVGTIKFSGEKFDKFLPKDSDVEITLHVDSTQHIKVSAYFPYIDETIEETLERYIQGRFNPDDIERELSNAEGKLDTLGEQFSSTGKDKVDNLRKEVAELLTVFENGRGNDDDERKVKERLRTVWKELESMEEEMELPKAKEKLNEAMDSLLRTNERFGNDRTSRIVDEMQRKVQRLMEEKKDVKIIQQLTGEIWGFEFSILWENLGFLVGYVKYYDDNFSSIKWKNSNEAKKLINEAKQMIAANPSKKALQSILAKVFDLLPEGTKPYAERIKPELLGYL